MPTSSRNPLQRLPPEAGSAAPKAEAPVDVGALRALLQSDADFERELVNTFVTHGNHALEQIQRALDDHDAKAVERAAHSLKGAAGSLFATALSASALRLEMAARAQMNPSFTVIAAEVRSEFARAVDYLQRRYSEGEGSDES